MGRTGHIRWQSIRSAGAGLVLLALQSGCISAGGSSTTTTTTGGGSGGGSSTGSCLALTGTTADSWDPSDLTAAGIGDSNHDPAVAVATQELGPVSGKLTGADGSFLASGHLMSVSFTLAADPSDATRSTLGAGGSISLVAEAGSTVTGSPGLSSLQVWPVLVKLVAPNPAGSTIDWINFNSTTCPSGQLYSCPSGSCSSNTGCTPGSSSSPSTHPSAYFGIFQQWDQHQNFLDTGKNVSVNTFPTCNWSSGACPFKSSGTNHFLASTGVLPPGTYTAYYAVLANYLGSTIGSSYTTSVKVRVLQKADPTLLGGAVDLNVVLVGNSNINASRTAKGRQNLNELIKQVHRIYAGGGDTNFAGSNASSTSIRIGQVTAYEWTCADGGDDYSTLTSLTEVPTLFKVGSALVNPADAATPANEAKALNIFIVKELPSSILGIAGGITGAMKTGTGASGLVFSSFGLLGSFNASCTGSGSCDYAHQSASFIDMGGTIAHEMGHFMGLNHPSEYQGTQHDAVPDTPECYHVSSSCSLGGTSCIFQASDSCLSDASTGRTSGDCSTACPGYDGSATFCPLANECQFNHVMWWTQKNITPSVASDGQIFSAQSGAILNFSPYVR